MWLPGNGVGAADEAYAGRARQAFSPQGHRGLDDSSERRRGNRRGRMAQAGGAFACARRGRPAGQRACQLRAATDCRSGHLQRRGQRARRRLAGRDRGGRRRHCRPVSPGAAAPRGGAQCVPARRSRPATKIAGGRLQADGAGVRHALSAGGALQARLDRVLAGPRPPGSAVRVFRRQHLAHKRRLAGGDGARFLRPGLAAARIHQRAQVRLVQRRARRAPCRPRPPFLDGVAALASRHAMVRDGAPAGGFCRRAIMLARRDYVGRRRRAFHALARTVAAARSSRRCRAARLRHCNYARYAGDGSEAAVDGVDQKFGRRYSRRNRRARAVFGCLFVSEHGVFFCRRS